VNATFPNPTSFSTMQGHVSVLLHEAIEFLAPSEGRHYLDCTFGGGGHSRALLNVPGTCVTALDCDPDAVRRGRELQAEAPGRFTIVDRNFRDLELVVEGPFHGILFDFGVSSFQLDQAERGFSFSKPGPADMRLDPRRGRPAREFLETATRDELIRAIRDYGEEPHWRRIIQAIENARGSSRLAHTDTLAELVAASIPARDRAKSRIHPATRAFQGIRIAVNGELDAIETALPAAFERLSHGGILVAISFHSLEDRCVKRWFRRFAGMPEDADDNRPADLREKHAELLTRKPLSPSETETRTNPRSRSARLRAIRKL
jgi:16S rRNA (cytosine1402-N4)-methyltransferase